MWQDVSRERREEPAFAFHEAASTSIKPFRRLLAEDNPDMRDYIKRVIGGNYDIKSASNGEEALSGEGLSSRHVDLRRHDAAHGRVRAGKGAAL